MPVRYGDKEGYMAKESTSDKSPTLRYICEPKDFLKLLRQGMVPSVSPWRPWQSVSAGTLRVWCVGRVPLFIRQTKRNFKVKWYFGMVPLFTLPRAPRSDLSVQTEQTNRSPRIYFSLGDIPYTDSGTGIQRVIKELCRQGLDQSDVVFIPVYLDYQEGVYRIASGWMKAHGLKCLTVAAFSDVEDDPEITVEAEDWLIYTMPNAHEWEHEWAYQQSFQDAGGRIGTILYDLIPIDHPEFTPPSIIRDFPIWLRNVARRADAVFSISKVAYDAFESWLNREQVKRPPYRGYFHLGGDFKSKRMAQKSSLPPCLEGKQYYMQVSTVEPRKGYADLITAFESLWQDGIEAALVIVGRKGWCVDDLVRRIEQHPQAGNLLFWLQGISDAELETLYQGCRAVIFASEAEGFGLPAIEGLHFGKTVIARDIPVFREIAGDALTYFTNGAEGLREAVRREWENPGVFSSHETPVVISWRQSFEQFVHSIKDAERKDRK